MRLLRNKTKLNPNKNKLIWTFGGCLPLNLSWPPLPILQHTINIQRQTGGLGISIAGGKGSTPYKGDDEVRPDVSVILRKFKVMGDTLNLVFCLFVQGIFISRVSAEGPAARAGVKVGDKLLEVLLLTPSSYYLCL